MNNIIKEYFNDHYHFIIEGDGENFSLTYSLYNLLTENKKTTKKKFKKENLKNVENKVKKITKSNKKYSKKKQT